MSFTRINPTPGWVFADTLTAAQMNAYDIDHANALDKSVAGDTLSGTVTMTSGGMLDVPIATTGIRVSTSGAKIAATASGASIEANASGALVQATVAGALVKVSGGGAFQSATGPTGDPNKAAQSYTFATPQGRTVRYTPAKMMPATALPSGSWVYEYANGFPRLQSKANSAVPILMPFTPHNGATMQSLAMYVQMSTGRASIPSKLPYVSIVRVRYTPIQNQPWWLWYTLEDIGAAAVQLNPPSNFPTPLTLVAYENSGNIQTWTNTLNSTPLGGVAGDPRIVDTSQYLYLVKLYDESGANSQINNTFPWFDITYSAISDLRFST
jgi:hypothetical protein